MEEMERIRERDVKRKRREGGIRSYIHMHTNTYLRIHTYSLSIHEYVKTYTSIRMRRHIVVVVGSAHSYPGITLFYSVL